jgi:hypothetical protein
MSAANAQPPTDLRALYDAVLTPRLAALEQDRLALRRAIGRSLLLIGIPAVIALYGSDLLGTLLPETLRPLVTPIAFVLVIAGVLVAGFNYALPGFTAYLNYRARFKRDIVAEIFTIVSPGATYAPNSYIQPATFERSGLFEKRGGITGDDLVRGRIGETPFEACEMNRHYSTGGKNSHTVNVFHGLFFRFDFNKTVRGHTVVQPQRTKNLSLGSRDGLKRGRARKRRVRIGVRGLLHQSGRGALHPDAGPHGAHPRDPSGDRTPGMPRFHRQPGVCRDRVRTIALRTID